MLIEISPQTLFNPNLSLRIDDSVCLVFLYETAASRVTVANKCETARLEPDNLSRNDMLKRDIMRNIESYAAIKKSASSCKYNIYCVNVVAYSSLDSFIRNGNGLITFKQYPQLILYINQQPVKFMRGRITDKTTNAIGFSLLNSVVDSYRINSTGYKISNGLRLNTETDIFKDNADIAIQNRSDDVDLMNRLSQDDEFMKKIIDYIRTSN